MNNINLYAICNNNVIYEWDSLGLPIELYYGNHSVSLGFHHSKLWLELTLPADSLVGALYPKTGGIVS